MPFAIFTALPAAIFKSEKNKTTVAHFGLFMAPLNAKTALQMWRIHVIDVFNVPSPFGWCQAVAAVASNTAEAGQDVAATKEGTQTPSGRLNII